MQKGDEASPNIILAGRALLVKMPINLEPHGIFGSNFEYFFFILFFSFFILIICLYVFIIIIFLSIFFFFLILM